MQTTYSANNVTWVDLANPTADEVRDVMDTYEIEPQIAEEIGSPTPQNRFIAFQKQLFFIVHFPVAKHTHAAGNKTQEIDFIVTQDVCITVRYDTVDPIHKFAKLFEVNAILDRSETLDHAGALMTLIFCKLYRGVVHELDYIRDELQQIEQYVFSGKEKEMVYELSEISRDLLNFEQSVTEHADVIEQLREHMPTLFKNTDTHLMRIQNEHTYTKRNIEQRKASFRELRETNDSLLYTKQNEIMKTLTIMAFVTFPLTLVTSIFGMNTDILPIVGQPNDFWIITGIMAAMAISFFAYFRYKRWL